MHGLSVKLDNSESYLYNGSSHKGEHMQHLNVVKYLKHLALSTLLLLATIIALFLILVIGYVIIVLAMLSLTIWFTGNCVGTLFKLFKNY